MTNYLELPAGPELPTVINAVIEIPKGSSNKYEYDKETEWAADSASRMNK